MKTQNWKVSKLKIHVTLKFKIWIRYSPGQLWKIVYLSLNNFHFFPEIVII